MTRDELERELLSYSFMDVVSAGIVLELIEEYERDVWENGYREGRKDKRDKE